MIKHAHFQIKPVTGSATEYFLVSDETSHDVIHSKRFLRLLVNGKS